MGTNLDILVIEDFILFKKDQDQALIKDYQNKFELDWFFQNTVNVVSTIFSKKF